MNEKELNQAILAELYKAADETWKAAKTGPIDIGSYTAAEVARMLKKRKLQIIDDKCYSVTVGDFSCRFTGFSVFDIVAKYEKLAGVGSRRKLFTVEALEEAGEKVDSAQADITVPAAIRAEVDYILNNTLYMAAGGYAWKWEAVGYNRELDSFIVIEENEYGKQTKYIERECVSSDWDSFRITAQEYLWMRGKKKLRTAQKPQIVVAAEPVLEAKTAAVPVAVQPTKAEAPGEEVQNTATAHIIEEVVPQCKAEQEPQKLEVSEKPLNEVKEAKAAAPAKEVVSRNEAVKAAPPLNTDAKKFAFAKVGVNIGDTLTFIDGTKVTAAAGNKVEYKGVLYTLSGFSKAFMPESKRNKADAYRGCEYFYNIDGVKLGKLFKEYQKSVAVPLEVQNEEEGKAKNKAVKPLKCSVRTITRPNKEKATETKESGRVYSWLRRTLGRVHRIAAAFSLL